MRFPDSFLDEIRARLPVSDVVRRRVQLRKQGREWRGLSPFNKERTPSFYVNDQKGFYHDFSSGKHGDIFRFVMETEGLSFPEAVERLANLAGIPIPAASPEAEAREIHRRTLHEVMELAATFLQENLAGALGARARGYLADRNVSPNTQIEFRIGYALQERFALKEYLGSRGVSISEMAEAGLLITGDDIPIPYDRFRDRVIIPIQDQRGRVIAFGGRALKNDVQPKYLNSPETSLFHKGACVFNFHRARQPAHEDGSVVVVEGYMDAIAVYQAGLKSVVASMGTAFTDEQIALLWRMSVEPIVCFDADNAGIRAAHRSLDRILPELKVGRTFRFAFMTGEKDPDDLIREKGLDAFKSVLSGSLPLWDVLWERETANVDVKTPDSQASLEHKLKTIVSTIKDRTVQLAYERMSRMQLANLFWQSARANKNTLPKKGFVRTELRIEKEGRRHGVQKVVLGILVGYSYFLEEKYEKKDLSKVEFSADFKAFFDALYDLLVVYGELSVQFIYDRLTPTFYDILEDLYGKGTADRPWGHKLLQRFPILRVDPPPDFVSRCIDHLIQVLLIGQVADEISLLKNSLDSDEASMRLLELVRYYHAQSMIVNNEDSALAEEAKEIHRIVLGSTAWGVAA
jgi:DNA primase